MSYKNTTVYLTAQKKEMTDVLVVVHPDGSISQGTKDNVLLSNFFTNVIRGDIMDRVREYCERHNLELSEPDRMYA